MSTISRGGGVLKGFERPPKGLKFARNPQVTLTPHRTSTTILLQLFHSCTTNERDANDISEGSVIGGIFEEGKKKKEL